MSNQIIHYWYYNESISLGKTQEESDWPMQDGAMVKKKFDDIFQSTRYSKALEAIMKAKKEKVLTAKDLKVK